VPGLPLDLFKRMRKANLTFGDRVHCPFLRPFFLSPQDEDRVRPSLKPSRSSASASPPQLWLTISFFAQFHLRPDEERLARMAGALRLASTLPGSMLSASRVFEICRVQR